MSITPVVPAARRWSRQRLGWCGTPGAQPGQRTQPPGSAIPILRRQSQCLRGNPDDRTESPGDRPEPKRHQPHGPTQPTRGPRARRFRAKSRAAARYLRDQRGNAAVELAPVAVVFLLFLGLAIAAGRITIAHMAVQAAARDAARQASIARTPAQAQTAARASAQTALRSDGLNCAPVVAVNTAGFSVPVGQPAQVSATVTCTVRLSDLTAVPGMPGARTITATVVSALDPYRAR